MATDEHLRRSHEAGRRQASKQILLANSIPRTLGHYQTELVETLTRVGISAEILADFPSIEDQSSAWGKVRLAFNSTVASRRAIRSEDAPIIQLWPSLGLIENLIWRSSNKKIAIVFHDPVPITRQFGYGKVSRVVATKPAPHKCPTIISHSADASLHLRRIFPRADVVELYHPIRSSQVNARSDREIVLVAGQCKPTRDLELLRNLGPILRKKGRRPIIVGRGWPTSLPGWEVSSRYLSEFELDNELGSAAIVLLPYTRYFQSGIVIRALERGTLSISPTTSFASAVFGEDSELLVDQVGRVGAWVEALDAGLSQRIDSQDVFTSYRERCDEGWRAFGGKLHIGTGG